jgi:uncharacterized SAM-binding protein YcdF (DUF218 family)
VASQSSHPAASAAARKRRRKAWPVGGAALLVALIVLPLWAILARHFSPQSNTSRRRFDAIVVLGTPADSDGNPTPAMLERVTEGVREYRRGVAPYLILTGAAAHNRFVEAEVMARVAKAQGVPPAAIIEEPHALDTIQNACYAARILEERDWHSVEVVSSAAHLPRAAMIFARLAEAHSGAAHLEWRMHTAPANLSPSYVGNAAAMLETLKTVRYLVWSRWVEGCGE